MDWIVAIEVALGLSLVYLLAAMGVTAINEAIAALADSRAKWLRRGVAALMSAGSRDAGLAAADAVYDSPYLSYLGQGLKGSKWWNLLSPRFEASYLGAWTLLQGTLSSVSETRRVVLGSVDDVRAAAARLDEHVPLRAVLEDLCDRAGQDMAQFRKLLDDWFATFEYQVAAWYKQKTHLVVMLLSVLVALLMNLDTLAMVRQLSTDKATRASLSGLALEAAKKNTLEEVIGLPAPAPQASGVPLTDEQRAARERRLAETTEALGAAGLRFGWGGDELKRLLPDGRSTPDWLRDLLLKLVGLIVSAGAISLGAPFWFDLLKRVVAIRAVGLNLSEKAQRATQRGKPT